MKLALVVATLMMGTMSQAAISMNYSCSDGKGTEINYEFRYNHETQVFDRLYNGIKVSVSGLSKKFTPEKYLVDPTGSMSSIDFKTGEFVTFKYGNLVEDHGDSETYSGRVSLMIKLENGTQIRRSVKVTCSSFGEA